MEQTEFLKMQSAMKQVLVGDEFDEEYAEELSFNIVQAIRDVPALIALLSKSESHSSDEIMNAVHDVVANRFALQRAAEMLYLPGSLEQLSE